MRTFRLLQPERLPSTVREIDGPLMRTEGLAVRCLVCTRRCLLRHEGLGFCTAVVNWGGRLFSTAYGVIGELNLTPIEERPIFHFCPGAPMLSLGGIGCNLRCAFCQNWEVAFRDARVGAGLETPNVPPDRAIALALQHGCAGIAWSHNEPTISPMYLRDCARLAREARLFTVLVTNGLLTEMTLDFLGPWVDAYKVDAKSLDHAFYQRVAGTAHTGDILKMARRAQQHFGIHVEVVTNLMPALNDSDDHIKRLADAILTSLGEQTPWHLTTYIPAAHMTDIPPTPLKTLLHAREIGLAVGLHWVYTDSHAAPETSNTYCPRCSTLAIERTAHQVALRCITPDGECANCGASLRVRLHPRWAVGQSGDEDQ